MLSVLVGVQSSQQPQHPHHLPPHLSGMLSLQEVEEDVQQVGVLVIGLYHIPVQWEREKGSNGQTQ